MAASLNIGQALVLQHMDIEDLSNPELQPRPVGEEVKKKRKRREVSLARQGGGLITAKDDEMHAGYALVLVLF